MPLPIPQLDDRRFQDIVDEAKTRLRELSPDWSDHNVSDPGVALLELFAWMTEMMIYRINRVPEKQYLLFMQMLGITLAPPTPARAPVTFTLSAPLAEPNAQKLRVKANTEVSTEPSASRRETITFVVDRDTEIVAPGLVNVYRVGAEDSTALPHSDGVNFSIFAASAAGSSPITPPDRTPKQADYLLIGLSNPVSAHTLRLEIELDDVEGLKAAGHRQDDPPLIWQALVGGSQQWKDAVWVERERDASGKADSTGGLSNTGALELRLPSEMVLDTPMGISNLPPAYYIRCLYRCRDPQQPGYDFAPILRSLKVATIGITVAASHGELVVGEEIGISSGIAGQSFRLAYVPALPFLAGEVVQVETGPGTGDWVAWEQPALGSFSNSCGKNHVLVDYTSGEVSFGPWIRDRNGKEHQYGNVPPRGARIRISKYRAGGGSIGNIAAGSLKVLKQTVTQLKSETNNYLPAVGGSDAETIAEAMLRVPRHIRTGNRAVTAQDYVELAQQADGSVARAHCVVPNDQEDDPVTPGVKLWTPNQLGQVQVLIIPKPASSDPQQLTRDMLLASDPLLKTVQDSLDQRRMLTTRLSIRCPAFVAISVSVRLKLRPQFDHEASRRIALQRLYQFLNPISGGSPSGEPGPGWEFGRPLYPGEIWGILQNTPGLEYIEWLNYRPRRWQAATALEGLETQAPLYIRPYEIIMSGTHTVDIA